MSILRKAACASMAGRIASGLLIISAGALVQGCASSNRDADGGSWKLWGNDGTKKDPETASRSAPKDTWRQPSSFDNDGPPSSPAYRGGRDPVTGRAQNEWPPAAPPQSQSTAFAPPPTPAPAPYPYQQYQPYQPAMPASSAPYGRALPAGPGSTVEVRQGDTLYRIAKANNVTVPALMQANGLQSETIKQGQQLTIPAR